MTTSDNHDRLRRQQRQARQQGLALSLQCTLDHSAWPQRRAYYVVLSTTPRDVAVTLLFSLDEVATFLAGDPALRETTNRTSIAGEIDGVQTTVTRHTPVADPVRAESWSCPIWLATRQVIQHMPRP
jgi:hypothetical protein